MSVSYSAALRFVGEVSTLYKVPVQKWIEQGITFKFIGDNIDKKKGVRDARSDHQSEMLHMYSVLVARSRLPALDLPQTGQVSDVMSLSPADLLPSKDDIEKVKLNLVVLVSRLITTHFKDLSAFSKVVCKHITHKYSQEMSRKSEVLVVDVLMKNEACGPDMVDIMQAMHGYLGPDCPSDLRIASGGDQLTCERQIAAQRHMMDGDTPAERLALLEPQIEDWHCLLCIVTVCLSLQFFIMMNTLFLYRWFGKRFTARVHVTMAHWGIFGAN